MSDQQRGYDDHDGRLAFDARRPVRGDGPMPMTLVLSGFILLVLMGAVFFVYRGGLSDKDGAPRPVGTAVNDIKAPPPAQAQPDNKAGDLTIYNAEAGAPPPAAGTVALAPAPEEPRDRPAPRPTGQVAATPLAPVAAGMKPSQAASIPPAAAQKAPVIAAAAVVTPTAKPLAAKPVAGGASVQIGAFGSPGAADKGWTAAANVAPGAALGKGKHVEAVTTANGGTLYRTLMTGFASRQEAEAFCITLKSAGKSCIVK